MFVMMAVLNKTPTAYRYILHNMNTITAVTPHEAATQPNPSSSVVDEQGLRAVKQLR